MVMTRLGSVLTGLEGDDAGINFWGLPLLELNFDASDELSKSSPNPPIPLKSLEAADAAATACVNKTRHSLEHATLENS